MSDNVIKMRVVNHRITLAAVAYPREKNPEPPREAGGKVTVWPAVIELRLDGKPVLVLDRAEAALAYAALGEAIDALDAAVEVDEAGYMTKERHDRIWGKIVAYFERSNRYRKWHERLTVLVEDALRVKGRQREAGRKRGEQLLKVTPAQVEKMRAWDAKGKSKRWIAKQLGVVESTVREYLKKMRDS